MTLLILKQFFMWCSIINFGLLLLSSLIMLLVPDAFFKIHHKWFNIDRQAFNITIYAFLGILKVALRCLSLPLRSADLAQRLLRFGRLWRGQFRVA